MGRMGLECTEKITYIRLQVYDAKSFIHLNDPYVLNESYTKDTTIGHYTEAYILLSVQYQATSIYNLAIFVVLL